MQTLKTEQLTIYPTRRKLLLLATASFLLAGLGATMGLNPDAWGGATPMLMAAYYVGTPFFLVMAIYLYRRSLVRRPMLIVNQQGIDHRATLGAAGLIQWDEIAGLRMLHFRKSRMLGISLRNAETVLARTGAVARVLAKINVKIAGESFWIPEASLPMSLESLVGEIRAVHEVEWLGR